MTYDPNGLTHTRRWGGAGAYMYREIYSKYYQFILFDSCKTNKLPVINSELPSNPHCADAMAAMRHR